MPEQDFDKLTEAARRQINGHLWRLAAYFGIANLAAIVVGMSYIFFVLPKLAAEEARSHLHAQVAALSQEVIKYSADAIRETGGAQAKARDLAERNKELDRQLDDINKKFNALKGTTPEQVADLIAKLQATPDLGKNIDLIGAVRTLESRLSNPTKPIAGQGYGRGAWVNTQRTAACPVGQIAVGLEVSYGGTCNTQCNADGGVIQEIRVLCRAL